LYLLNVFYTLLNLNLQDVRELIPEFFYLPEFLENGNNLNLGTTQKLDDVDNVILPPWAKGNAKEFVNINRQALESKYVSEHLHEWIDLIFGYKQRGDEAINSMNVFIHLTYDGEVDVDAITDPVLRDATIAQINNFGQTPCKLFNKKHPKKIIPDCVKRLPDNSLTADTNAINWHQHTAPPLCVVGGSEYSYLEKLSYTQAIYPGNIKGFSNSPIEDMTMMSRDRYISVPVGCTILHPICKQMIKYRGITGAVIFENIIPSSTSSRLMKDVHLIDKDVSIHENLHSMPISCLCISKDGQLMVTASEDTTLRLWDISKHATSKTIKHIFTYNGHTTKIISLDISTEFQIIISGGIDGMVCIWDIRNMKLIRILDKHIGSVLSVSINQISGCILTLTSSEIRYYSINGDVVSKLTTDNNAIQSSNNDGISNSLSNSLSTSLSNSLFNSLFNSLLYSLFNSLSN
jgi:hypothetical protein